jgi:hypothetical protein
MSVLMYKGIRPEVQVRVMSHEVISMIMSGYFIAPNSASKEV